MNKCMTRGVATGAGVGVALGLLARFAIGSTKTEWATAKKWLVALGLGGAVGILAGFASKTSCESGRLSPAFRGVGKLPYGLKCPDVQGISKSMWKRGIRVEMEHTTNPRVARCISASHFLEDPQYYNKLAVMEGKRG
jgi:hypothetical protein